ncbi:hypothetical protein PTTG_03415 [Puccinia triticina 1-1 BBBD Race 1]|uniref:Uncharacterized protein n=2 Tax=Puccinia triticina TaxID=208348 RepID=A0A0C4ERJ6_PUCT1|nr:uncharacterized protein PtA15_7A689 [Puccinia triticina]OAV96180.1 hypothetical protein PTTG_03415 [Puccinia triticina 1-1 BBBD Race 1]WAQ86960.1 hypothetical protein PtA15_7A689 [Puccinia triticina]WAR56822.1 hypothetical protein PtB15_7B673 [Puccinia triticina]
MSLSQLSRPIPASETKHLTLLEYPLWPPIEGYSIDCGNQRVARLIQNDNCRTSTGSTLWLSSQILSAYLLATLSKNVVRAKRNHSLRAIEVGAGTALSYTVLATDIEPSLTQILVPNVRNWMEDNNSSTGKISTCRLNWNLELDWTSINTAFSSGPNDKAPGNLNSRSLSVGQTQPLVDGDGLAATPIDLIVSADTVYAVELIRPLLNTLSTLSARSPKPPMIHLALERRDPSLVDKFFQMAVEMGFRATQIEPNRLRKMVESMGWIDEDWEAVEVWKLSMKQKRGV